MRNAWRVAECPVGVAGCLAGRQGG